MEGTANHLTRPLPGPHGPGVPQRIDDDRRPPSRVAGGQLRPGDRVGRFVVRCKLGRGGMGVVYGAYDSVLGRRVALKLVRHRDQAPRIDIHVDERLRREAQALARLSHPNVVSLYDVGTCEWGDYLALELVPGIDLDQWLRAQPRRFPEIVEVFVEAGRGLSAAHDAGFIHRDFKPTNVIVGPHGHVTVVDFGLARCAEQATTTTTPVHDGPPHSPPWSRRLTATNVILGTRGYMAPEQLLGLGVTARADQFSFCVALFEALYGVRPYPGANAVQTATSFARGNLVVPDDRRGVPARLHQVLLRGLSIEPDDRHPSMDALLAALGRSMPPSRARRLMVAALAGTAVLGAGVGAWLHAMTTADTASPSAIAAPSCDPAAPEGLALP